MTCVSVTLDGVERIVKILVVQGLEKIVLGMESVTVPRTSVFVRMDGLAMAVTSRIVLGTLTVQTGVWKRPKIAIHISVACFRH